MAWGICFTLRTAFPFSTRLNSWNCIDSLCSKTEVTKIDPITYFNHWFVSPIDVSEFTVLNVIEALDQHPSAEDQNAQDYVMPLRRCREKPGRFRVWAENQDTFYCFVNEGDELMRNPPVYFESCLDLSTNYGLDASEVIDGDHLLVAETFTGFIWHMLGHHICLRRKFNDHLNPSITGIRFSDVKLDVSFQSALCREFPAGYGTFFRHDTICIPEWGAAFLNRTARDKFVSEFGPEIDADWAE